MVNIGSSQAWQGADGARRRGIYHRLERVSTTAAAFWHDACFLVAVGGLLDVSTHLVGHALREVDGVLLEVLLPDGIVLPNEKSRVARVDAIAPTLGLDASVTRFWRRLELHEVAHRHPPFPRVDDDEFRVLLDNYSNLLEIVSSEFERRFTIWVERLDTFLAIQAPTKAVVKRLRKEIPWSAVTLHYFFDRLTDPRWLSPLVKARFFETLPDVVFDEASGTTRFHLWPQAAYLRVVAAVDGEAVSKVVARLPPSSNPWVTSALIEIGIALPPACRREVHERIMGAIRESDALFLSLDLIEKFAVSYANDGLSEQALDLVSEVLSVENVTTEADAVESVELARRIRSSRLGSGSYFEAARGLMNVVVDLSPKQPVIELFADLLSSAITRDLSVGRANIPYDHSNIWRQVIGGEPSGPYEERQALVGVVRDLLRRTAFDEPAELSSILQYLVGRDWHVFRRIALHVAAQPACFSRETVDSLLMNRSLFEAFDTEQEYLQLLGATGCDLSPANKATILQWIDEGPSLTSGQHVQSDETETTVERMEIWQLDRLRPIEGQLDARRHAEFVALRDLHRTPDPAVARPQFTSWAGTRSPIDPAAVAAMPPEGLFDYLQDWRPSKSFSFDRPTRAGLGDSLGQAVAQDPAHFGALIRDAVTLDPTYALIEGATSAIRGGRELPWDDVLHLIAGVLAVEPAADGEIPGGRFTGDTTLASARLSITTLIETATRTVTSGLTVSRRAEIFAVIEHLARDPDPSPSRAADADPSDPHMRIALNSVRGRALALAVEHLNWLSHAGVFKSIADCPEVEALVTERLAVEDSPAVVSVLGRHFARIAELDAEWAGAIKQPLFKGRHSQAGRHDAWCVYLDRHSTEAAFSLVMDLYEWHVAQLDPVAGAREFDRGLVHHVVALYWAGNVGDIGTGDTMIEKLFASAAPELRGYTTEYIGHCVDEYGSALDEAVGERLTVLWNWRRQAAETTSFDPSFASELRAFQWWFTADNLEADWLLDNFEWTVQNGPIHEHAYQVANHLAVVANRSPLNLPAVLRCYEYLIAPSGAQILGWDQQLYEVTATAIASDNADLRTQAVHLANKLISRGYLASVT